MAAVSNGVTTITGLVLLTADLARATSTVVHNIVGRSSPIAVLGTTSARTGTLTFRCASMSTIEEIVTLTLAKRCTLTTPEQPALTGMPFVATDFGYGQWERGAAGWWWDLRLAIAEVS